MVDLSVIIPTFNRAEFLPSVVASIDAGGIADVEIVVVDDGSTDDTEAAVAKLGVKYVRQSNAGPAAARNTGAAVAAGRYLAFLDSDDLWLRGVAAQAVAVLDRHPEIAAVFTDAEITNGPVRSFLTWPGRPGIDDIPAQRPEPNVRTFDPGALLQRLVERNFIFLGSLIVRRETFTISEGFDSAFFGTEDWEFCLRLAARHSLGFFGTPLAACVRHENNLSSNTDRMQADSCRTLLKLRSDPTPQVAALRGWIDQKLNRQLFDYAYLAYGRGDYPEARQRFRHQMQTCGWGLKPLAFWTTCSLPAGVTRRLRGIKKFFQREPAQIAGCSS